MAILSLVLMGLMLFCVPGLPLLLAGLLGKRRRKGRLISGIVLCAPLTLFFLMGAAGTLVETIGGRL